jgi:hypothetical protein
MCPDRRQRVLPLLFARPLTGTDYVVAKVGAMFAIVFAFSFLPQVVLFVGQMLVSEDGALDYARENAEVLWQVPCAVAVLALYYSSISVAIASMTSRRIIAGATIIGLFLISGLVSSILVGQETRRVGNDDQITVVTNEQGEVIFEGGGGGFEEVVERDEQPAALMNLLTLPLIVRDLVFFGHVDREHALSGVPNGGLYAILVYAGVVLIALVVLWRRYDEVER